MPTNPGELNDFIARALVDVVPVDTGRLRSSISARDGGIWAEDYYPYVMSLPKYASLETAAIQSATDAFAREYEDNLDI